MKNSTSGSARRSFFRSSSRRLRVGTATPTANGAPGPAAGPQGQQSLIAGGRSGAKAAKQAAAAAQQQQLSPLEGADQMLGANQAGQQQQQGRQAHNSPSEFGGSSSGGFTYFSGKLLSLSLSLSRKLPSGR